MTIIQDAIMIWDKKTGEKLDLLPLIKIKVKTHNHLQETF